MNKKIIWGIVIALVVIGVGIYLTKGKKTETVWLNYSNSMYGFNFQYPADWKVNAVGIDNPENSTIFIQSPERAKDLKDKPSAQIRSAEIIIKVHPSNYKPSTGNPSGRITFNGMPADIYNYTGDGIELVSILINNGDYTYEIIEEEPVKIVYTEILSTFKFTSPSISDLKTYTNSKFEFEVKYPQNYVLEKENTNGFLAMFRDQSKIFPNRDLHNYIYISAQSTNGITTFIDYIEKYPIVSAQTNKPFNFKSRIIGSNTFYYTQTERFEGTLSFEYYILNNKVLYRFSSVSEGVDWTNPNLDEENDSTHLALRLILANLKFTITN